MVFFVRYVCFCGGVGVGGMGDLLVSEFLVNCFIVYCYVRIMYVLYVSGFNYRLGGRGGIEVDVGVGGSSLVSRCICRYIVVIGGYICLGGFVFDSCMCLFALVGFDWLLGFLCRFIVGCIMFERGIFCRLLVGILGCVGGC